MEEFLTYSSTDDKDILAIISEIRNGIEYSKFKKLTGDIPLSSSEWSEYLHISERTFQRYKKDKRKFNKSQSEKIIQILLLFNLGIKVFGSIEKFSSWLDTKNLALGKRKPKELLDNSFGIDLLKEELNRIAHGILA